MSCHYLRPAWFINDPDTGKREVTFNKRSDQLFPDTHLPCQKCSGCKAAAAQDWAVRLYHESLYHERSSFITLTYEDAPDTISRKHIKDFVERLKYYVPGARYFLTGEYGEETHRPHYHAVLFGADFRGGAYTIRDGLWGNVILDRIWTHGNCSVGDFSIASASYVSGYVTKKIDDPDTFSSMSRKPPIGWQFAMQNQDLLDRNGKYVIDGREYPVPKVYFDWTEPSPFRPGAINLEHAAGMRQGFIKERSEQQVRSRQINLENRGNIKARKPI